MPFRVILIIYSINSKLRNAFLSEKLFIHIINCKRLIIHYRFYLNKFSVRPCMSIKFKLTKQGQESLKKRIQTYEKQSQELTIKTTYAEIVLMKNSQCQTNENTPQDKSEQESVQLSDKKCSFEFKPSQKNDDHRHPFAHKDGGLMCDDPKQVDKLRSVGKEMIKLIGRKILSGEFNLTKISIPIKSCYPKTALFNSVKGYSIFPYFMKSAAECNDPLERFKITLTCLVAQPYYLNMFLKPLNPILGQTLEASLADGTKIYAEQISHHPPISYFLIYGPEECYRFSGFYDVEVSPGMNSLTIRNRGKRVFEFKDGTSISTTYATNEFSGTFFGTSRVEELNSFTIEDKKNDIRCDIEFDKVKKKPSDYFITKIFYQGKPVSHLEGTCLGFLNIDNKRYWDGRDLEAFQILFDKLQKRLPSDWQKREDLQALLRHDLEAGQKLKEQLEQKQRKDAKLRKKHGQGDKKEEK